MRTGKGLILGLLLTMLIASGVVLAELAERAQAQVGGNPIVVENQLPGSTAWQLNRNGRKIDDGPLDPGLGNYGETALHGYPSQHSIAQGDVLELKVSTRSVMSAALVPAYTINIFRMGYYGGAGARLVSRAGPLPGVTQPACPLDISTGLIECDWMTAFSTTVPLSWTSGIYIALLTNSENYQSHITFVVRDNRPAKFLYAHAMLTMAAYNNFPNDGQIGKSLYESNSYGPNTLTNAKRAVVVSFDRPDTVSDFGGPGFGDSDYYEEIFTVYWLEKQGYDVTYAADYDLHADALAFDARLEQLRRHKAVIFGGHLEYATGEMFTMAERLRDAGVSLIFTGSNELYWQVRLESSATGAPYRRVVCYKASALDPMLEPRAKTDLFRSVSVNRPEQILKGISYAEYGNPISNTRYIVANAAGWPYSGTNAIESQVLTPIIGREVDNFDLQFPAPISTSYQILASSPYTAYGSIVTQAQATLYQAPSGALVFAPGTLSFSWGLARPAKGTGLSALVYQSPVIQGMFRNILDRVGDIQPTPVPTATPTATHTPVTSQHEVHLPLVVR